MPKAVMLRVDDNLHGEFGTAHLSRDGRVRIEQSAGPLRGCGEGGSLRAYREGAEGPAVPAAQQQVEGHGAAISEQDQRPEPRSADAADSALDATATHPAEASAAADFPRRYTGADIALLAEADAVHEDLSGPAMRRLPQRAWEVYGDERFQRLAGISASHIYNLRDSPDYRKLRVRIKHTRARQVAIGERRQPKGKPGYIRLDTVHQGQHDDKPGVYHINAVDRVTQWQVVGCVETICERDLIPVLEAMPHQFPFRVLGFPLRQRPGAEQESGPVAEQIVGGGVHQVEGVSYNRQRSGGGQAEP